ncbi:MAG: DNA polymerase IV [Deltaproteobacteria bacterium]|nr:DNA polymerase IV [Deltaproteobacteria bacterium]
MRAILHVDMDAFYASVEQRDEPRLRGRPVVVGGRSRRGVVAAASYEARPYGVRSAMPMGEALRRCPDAVVVPPRMGRYAEVSARVFDIFRRFTPLVEGLSLDEAFLDVTASRSLFGGAEPIARRIKESILAETGLTASAGVAPCKFVAKVASDLRKPDGLVVVAEHDVASFLDPLPIERMWGVGQKTAPRLRASGLATIGDLARAETRTLEGLLGRWGTEVQLLARGIDERDVVPGIVAKSVGAEETYENDLVDIASIERCLLDQSARVASRLVHERLSGTVVVVKLKDSAFRLFTRRATLPEPVADTDSIFEAARSLVARFPLRGRRFRLTGVAVAGLREGPPSPRLFPDARAERRRRVEQLTADVTDRFGALGLTRAALVDPEHASRAPVNVDRVHRRLRADEPED